MWRAVSSSDIDAQTLCSRGELSSVMEQQFPAVTWGLVVEQTWGAVHKMTQVFRAVLSSGTAVSSIDTHS
jgi:hypothetical protein